MTSADKIAVLEIYKEILSPKQRVYFESYIRNNKHNPNASREIGITMENGFQYLYGKAVQLGLRIFDLPETSSLDNVPTLEYLSAQWKVLYDRALEKGNDSGAAGILDKRMKYYETFDGLRKEDKVNLGKMTIDELVKLEEERHEKIMSLLTKGAHNVWKGELDKVIFRNDARDKEKLED
jgi:hypothetical protein